MMSLESALFYLSDLLNDLVQGQESSQEEVNGQIEALCVVISFLNRVVNDTQQEETAKEKPNRIDL